MKEYVDGRMLRTGYTTGSCAAAAAGCAADILFSKESYRQNDEIYYSIALPSGEEVALCICDIEMGASSDAPWVRCGVKKDAGDDPDVTDGLMIYAKVGVSNHVTDEADSDIVIVGGEGVGTVTKPGLDRPVGDPAINTVPGQMIKDAVKRAAKRNGFDIKKAIVEVMIDVPGGREIAKKTFNPRLGIEGGISIIGTTGIVHPMSRDAFVNTIRIETKMLKETKADTIVFSPGNYGERFAKEHLGEEHVIKCGNFIGEAIDAAVEYGFSQIIFVGHFGKLVKCSLGIMNTHSKEADGRLEAIAGAVALSGGEIQTVVKVLKSNTTEEALELIRNRPYYNDTLDVLRNRIEYYLNIRSHGKAKVGAVVFSMEDENNVCITENILSRYRTG